MGLLRRIRDVIGWLPARRNKPDSMAWVKGIGKSAGAEQLNNRAVRTVRIDRESGLWVVDPPQRFVCTRDCLFGLSQRLITRGEGVWVVQIADEYLEPWREIGDGDTDESAAWVPPLPASAPARRPVDA